MSVRSNDISPYLMVACVQLPVRKFPERLRTAWFYLKHYTSHVGIDGCVCALSVVLRTPRNHHRFRPRRRLWRPLFAPSFTSARVQSRLEFVELGGDMCSNCQGEVPARTVTTSWYKLVPRTIHVRCLLYTSPSPRDRQKSRMPSSA